MLSDSQPSASESVPDPNRAGSDLLELGDPESLGLDLLHGRYFVECNLEGMSGRRAGEWTVCSRQDTLEDALRACSVIMEMAKDCLGIPRVDAKADGEIERWIRVIDMWNEEVVLWVEDSRLHVLSEVRKKETGLRQLLGLPARAGSAEARP